jgi:hypothetical protein
MGSGMKVWDFKYIAGGLKAEIAMGGSPTTTLAHLV